MSSPSAIATVTQSLAGLLRAALHLHDGAFAVTNLPLDKANAVTDHPNRLNLFLIQPSHNAALRNTNAAFSAVHGATAQPPLALSLTYMITAYGDAEPELSKDQQILGVAMQFLNDHPVLTADDIANVAPASELEQQVERVRVTPRDLSLEEMSRMWSTFMTQYRTSAAYDVSVVLIDNGLASPAAAPVLRRGEQDSGVFAQAGLPPLLTGATGPELLRRGTQVTHQPAVRLGESLVLEGERLPTEDVLVQVRSPAWGERWVELDDVQLGASPGTVQVTLSDPPPQSMPPGAALAWSPGVFNAVLVAREPGIPDIVSSSVAFALAPRVEVSPTNSAAGDVTLTVRCLPPPRIGQIVRLVLGSRGSIAPSAVAPPPVPGQPATLTFGAVGLTVGDYLVRLVVDGVESLPYRVTQVPGAAPGLERTPDQVLVVA